jgi:hypothetical protein
MRKEVPRRTWSAITGIGFVVLTVIAIAALGGEPPKADDSAVDIARYLADKRDARSRRRRTELIRKTYRQAR